MATEVVEDMLVRLCDRRRHLLLDGLIVLHHSYRVACLASLSSADTMARDEELAPLRPLR